MGMLCWRVNDNIFSIVLIELIMRIKLSIEGRLDEWNSKESSISIWEWEVDWFGREEIIFYNLSIKDSTDGQSCSTLIIVRPKNSLYKPNILFNIVWCL